METSFGRGSRNALYFIRGADDRAGVVIFDLVDTDTILSREIVAKEFKSAEEKAKEPSPIQEINELIRLSNIPIEISIEWKQKAVARRNGGELYSVVELSDRERIAFLFDTEVFTTPPSSLVLIDEPECHLHRSLFPRCSLYCFKIIQIVPSLYQLMM